MSTTASNSGGSRVESAPFVEWSKYNENRWRYEGDPKSASESDIYNPDAQNATTIRYDINYRDDPEKRRKYKRLSEYNSGLKNGPKWTNDEYNTYLVNQHLIRALASQVGLNPRYKREAERLFLRFDLQKFGTDAATVAFCTCVAVVKNSEENDRKCHPCVPDKKMDPEFRRVASAEDYRKGELISLYNKVTQAKDKYWG
ncbi:hypothetical protein M0R88_09545 [Halorussus gelatinilyticus]|uniref:Uncharacterized protein n=1 Tax=Halorussus gelatinilyticus TaxID=2937524 RepID=A0A8U0IDI2_9EURY|nr:hypothetical protein [Halorussus gelatinilyticus]UPV98775.1 hypothetical protein M0R88_09545 [Halorussus gelatinilyticus]